MIGSTTLSKLLSTSAILCSLVYFANAWGQTDVCGVRHVRFLEPDNFFVVVNPPGVVFPPRANSLLLLDQPILGAGTLFTGPKNGVPGDPETLTTELSDPINMTLDGRGKQLFFFEHAASELTITKLRNKFKEKKIDRFGTFDYGVQFPSGVAVDPKTGTLFILDGDGPKIIQVMPGGNNRKDYEGATALAEGRISELFLQQSTVPGPLRGLGFNHADGRLYVFSLATQELYKIREDGELVRVGDLSGFGIDARGLVFAWSLDQTDDARIMNLYIASSGGPNGQVSEWALTPCVQGSAQ
jgi:hypothetical protein